MEKCGNCGKENESHANFCEKCGTKLESVEQEAKIKKLYCHNCQHELIEGTSFCENCGTRIFKEEELIPKISQNSEINQYSQEKIVKKPMSKKNKMIGIFITTFLILGSAIYIFLSNQNSQENQVESLVMAIKNKDSSYLVDRILTEDPSLTITEENIKPMLKYFDDNKEEINNLKKAFETQQSFNGFSLKKEGKKAILFPKYNIDVKPAYTTIESNVKNSVIKMNDKEIATTNSTNYSKNIGPLIPGNYQFQASIKGKKDKKESSYTLLPSSEESVDMRFVMVKIPIQSNMDEATVLINNKEVGQVIDGEAEVGPLLWNNKMSVQLVKKTNTEKIETKIKELKKVDLNEESGTYPTVVLDFNSASDYDIEEGVKSFYSEFSNVVNSSSYYEASEFAGKYYIEGEKNNSFSGINDYINWCRERSAKKEYDGVSFNVNVKSVETISNNTYKIKYNVTYRTTYPYSTKKTPRVEAFDYSDVKVQFEKDEDSHNIKNFKFFDMGDGGKKVQDNRANE